MTYNVPLEVYENFEEIVGKEKAKIIVKSLESSIKEAFLDNKEITKEEVSKELKQDLATKADLKNEIELVRKDAKIQTTIIIAVIIVLNQNSLEFIAKLLGIMK